MSSAAVVEAAAASVGTCLRVRPALRSSAEVAIIKAALSHNPFFADWDDASLQLISGVLGHASAGSGELVLQRGEAVSGVYIVLSGTCDVAVPHPTNPRGRADYRVLHTGDVCGLEALLSDDHRAAAAVTAGPAGVELAVLGSSSWADVCTRAAAGGPPAAKWAALRTTLLCTFLRLHAAAAPQRGGGGGKGEGQQPAGAGGVQPGRGGVKWDAEVELASAAEVDAAGVGAAAEDGPYEVLRQERLALLLACFSGTSLSAMPHAMLLEAARGCMLRPLKPFTPLYTVNGTHNSQAVLLVGSLQMRSLRPLGRSGSRAPARAGAGQQAPSTGAASSGASGPTSARTSASSIGGAAGGAPEAGPASGAAAGTTSGGGADAAAAAAGPEDEGQGEAAGGEELEELEEAEEADDAAATASGENEAGDDAGLEAAGAGGKAQVSAEEAERRLTERFGPVVGSEGVGASLCELSLAAITGAKGRRPPRRTSLVTGAAPALVLVIPVAALRRGYGAARSTLVATRTAALLRPGAWGVLGEALRSSCLNPAELSALALAAAPARLAAGALVARQGAPIDALYLVQEGELRLLDDPDSAAQQQQQEQAAAAAQPPPSAFALAATSSSASSGAGPSAALSSLLADSVIGSELSPMFARREGDTAVVPGGSSAAAAATAAVTAAASAMGGSAVGASATQVAAALKNLPSIMTINAGGVFGAGLLGCPSDSGADELQRASGGGGLAGSGAVASTSGGGAGGSGSLPKLLPSPPVGPPPAGIRGASMTGGRPPGPASPLVGRAGTGGSSSGSSRTADGGAASSSGGAGAGAVATVSLTGAAPGSPSLVPQPPSLGRTSSRSAAEARALLLKSPSLKAIPSLRRSVSVSVPETPETDAGPSAAVANGPRTLHNAPPPSSSSASSSQQNPGASAGGAATCAVKVQQGRFPATAVAVGPVRLLVLAREALVRLAPVLAPLLLELAAQHLEVLERRRLEAQDMHTKLPQVITVEGLPAAPVVRDPYAVTRRRAAERKAAVESLMNEGAPAVRAPEVLPPEQVLARPSLLLERMGFKVPKIRGLTSGTASGGESEPASGEPSPGGQGQLVARAGSTTGAFGAGGGGGGGAGSELPLAHAASLGSAGIGGSSGPHSPHMQYRSRLSGSGVPGAPGVLGSMHLVPGPPQASSPMRYSNAGTGPGSAGGGNPHLLHLPRLHTVSSAGLDNALHDPGFHGPQASFSSQSLGVSKQHNAQLHGALTQRGLGGGDGPSTAPGSPSAGLPRLRVSASGMHDSPMRQRLTNAGLMGTGTPGTASPVARYSATGFGPGPSYGGAPAAAQVAAALGLFGGGGGGGSSGGLASRTHSFSTPGLPPHLMPQQFATPATGGGSHLPSPMSPMRLLVTGGDSGALGGSSSTPCSPSAKAAPRAQALQLTTADVPERTYSSGAEAAAAGPDGSRFSAVTSAVTSGSRPPLAPQPSADAATSSTLAFTAGAYAAAAREAAAAKGAAAAAEAAAWMSQLDGGRRSDNGLLRRTAVVASAAATATGAAGRGAAHGGAGELSAAAALAVLGGGAGGSVAARK
ncbi:hypothetical protein HXX76_005292 [Chlamydomonas incerta]|uniref:Cyclic nucleotide-binding domain-containing protein n=1 Tax=Chlamydomonas incerta TaxID=51695 RepID=A0A835W645_CHLIN|nr:hypothetical protein HXX76_005292 [Chlamydomonas incerta]|eukprot:KAG2438748.1 hypothetical protein HXX76_005292 [Chlamydomonas incerta]